MLNFGHWPEFACSGWMDGAANLSHLPLKTPTIEPFVKFHLKSNISDI